MALNLKQAKFVAEYLVDGNATRAAIASGYSEHTAAKIGSENLQKPDIKAAIGEGQAKLKALAEARAVKKNIISKEQWVALVAEIATADITRFVDVDAGRLKLKDTKDWAPGAGRLVRKISMSAQGAVSFELHAKGHEIEMLAKHFGWIKDQVEHSGGIDTSPSGVPKEELQKLHSNPEALKHARALALSLSKPPEPPKDGSEGGSP